MVSALSPLAGKCCPSKVEIILRRERSARPHCDKGTFLPPQPAKACRNGYPVLKGVGNAPKESTSSTAITIGINSEANGRVQVTPKLAHTQFHCPRRPYDPDNQGVRAPKVVRAKRSDSRSTGPAETGTGVLMVASTSAG